MDTFFDLMIVVVMALSAAALVSLVLMFLLKNKTAQRVSLFLAAILGIYIATVGWRINAPGFVGQVIIAVVLGLACLAGAVLSVVKKEDDRLFLVSRILAASGLVLGFANAFLV